VHVAEPRTGEPVLAVAAREREGRKRANATINSMVGWYNGVRRSYTAK